MGSEDDPELIALGRATWQIRVQQGMSRSELAGALGVEQRWVQELEAGRLDPPFDVLRAVADGLSVKASEFLTLAEEMIRSEEGQVQS
jgi:transcriptional regulator with XRE-family HTH domain